MFVILEKVLGSTDSEPLSDISYPCARVIIQAKRSNSNAIQIAPGTVATGVAYELPKPTADVQLPELPIKPQYGTQCIDLKDWSALGAQGEGVNLLVEIY